MLQRVRKLLALTAARGATEHEAATALILAKRLLARHNLTLEATRTGSKPPPVRHASIPLDPYAPGFQRLLADSIARHHFCTLLDDPPLLHFAGRPDNVAVALELYTWAKLRLGLISLVEEQRAREGGTWRRGWRSAFLAGAAARIEQRLNEHHWTSTHALVRLTETENRRYMKRTFGRIRYLSPRAPYVETAHNAGWTAGGQVDLQGRREALRTRPMLTEAV